MQSFLSADLPVTGTRARRALRATATALTVLSLLLCLATVALWVRSYRIRDIVGFCRAGGNSHLVQSLRGRFHLLSDLDGGCVGGVTYSSDRIPPRGTWHGHMSSYPNDADVVWRLGCVWQTYVSYHFGLGQSYSTSNRLIVVPYWLPAAVFAIAPSIGIVVRLKRFRLLGLMVLVAVLALILAFLRPPAPP